MARSISLKLLFHFNISKIIPNCENDPPAQPAVNFVFGGQPTSHPFRVNVDRTVPPLGLRRTTRLLLLSQRFAEERSWCWLSAETSCESARKHGEGEQTPLIHQKEEKSATIKHFFLYTDINQPQVDEG